MTLLLTDRQRALLSAAGYVLRGSVAEVLRGSELDPLHDFEVMA